MSWFNFNFRIYLSSPTMRFPSLWIAIQIDHLWVFQWFRKLRISVGWHSSPWQSRRISFFEIVCIVLLLFWLGLPSKQPMFLNTQKKRAVTGWYVWLLLAAIIPSLFQTQQLFTAASQYLFTISIVINFPQKSPGILHSQSYPNPFLLMPRYLCILSGDRYL